MVNSLIAFARDIVGQSAKLLGPDESVVRELGATPEALGFSGAGLGALCPDLVHEAQTGLGRLG